VSSGRIEARSALTQSSEPASMPSAIGLETIPLAGEPAQSQELAVGASIDSHEDWMGKSGPE
jgi:hypothetical protein